MPQFKCVKPTTFKGRQVQIGAGLTVSDKVAATLEDNPFWAPVKGSKPTAPKAPATDPNAPSADEVEAQRQELLKTAKDLGGNPRANTGIPKLEALIRELKKVKPDEGGTEPESVI